MAARTGTYAALVSGIEAAESRLEVLRPWVARLIEARDEYALKAPRPDDQSRTATLARAGLHALVHGWHQGVEAALPDDVFLRMRDERLPALNAAEDEVRLLERQVELLRERLPSESERDEAEGELGLLLDSLSDLDTEASTARARLLDTLADAAEMAKKLASLREQHQQRINQARELAKQWDLHAEAARTLSQPEPERRLLRVLAEVVRRVALGSPVDSLLREELEKAREAVRGQREAA